MPDITMCVGTDCPLKDNCYRHLANPNGQYQSYFSDVPYRDGDCDQFWRAYDRDARVVEVCDTQGDLMKLEATDVKTGEHLLDGHWNPADEQTPPNRENFRKWFTMMLNRKSIRPIN